MSWPALITSIALTILLASPFQWFLGAGGKTFIRREPSPGSAWGQASFASGIMAIAWVGLFGGLAIDIATLAALASRTPQPSRERIASATAAKAST